PSGPVARGVGLTPRGAGPLEERTWKRVRLIVPRAVGRTVPPEVRSFGPPIRDFHPWAGDGLEADYGSGREEPQPMTTGSTTTPRAAASQPSRLVKRLGAVSLLALALLFVRPSEVPVGQGSSPIHMALGSGFRGG